jgi:hypothetical protein
MAPFGALVFSRDPVAGDRIGLEILERLRREHGRPSLAQAGRNQVLRPAHSAWASRNLERIDLKVRWSTNSRVEAGGCSDESA